MRFPRGRQAVLGAGPAGRHGARLRWILRHSDESGTLLRRGRLLDQLTRLDRLARHLAGHRPLEVEEPGRTQAAVAVVWARATESLLLIRRAEFDGDPWSGQMGLPGGRRHTEDPDLLTTAIRETREELGLDLDPALRLGALDDHAPRSPLLPPITVRPFVFQLERVQPLALNHEVAWASWVPLDRLLAPGVYQVRDIEVRGYRTRRPGYLLPEGLVWGMTERILTPAIKVLTA